jgi:hypothetical protein
VLIKLFGNFAHGWGRIGQHNFQHASTSGVCLGS